MWSNFNEIWCSKKQTSVVEKLTETNIQGWEKTNISPGRTHANCGYEGNHKGVLLLFTVLNLQAVFLFLTQRCFFTITQSYCFHTGLKLADFVHMGYKNVLLLYFFRTPPHHHLLKCVVFPIKDNWHTKIASRSLVLPFPNPQNTHGLVGQTPMHPPVPWKGYRAGPVFHDWDEKRTVPPESEVLLSAKFSSPVPWHRLSRRF